jgi:uncharacterized protein YyaL (SSP411 family)
MPNLLAAETSPYLLQHKDNPVAWHAWGADALAEATERDVPLLISIGYSSCHWCHVMAHECFEDAQIADVMNRYFVCIKVDREERPDLDAIYMNAVQGMTGHGGWPLNVFCTPDGVPFFGGTYWPPTDRQGMAGFPRVLETIATAWKNGRDALLENAGQMRAFLNNSTASLPSGPITAANGDAAILRLREQFDATNGGFGNAPKFPQAPVLEFLLRHAALTGSAHALKMATTTLARMADGGIHDQIAGGFARYAVDTTWLTPHFEKMLYDNGQMLSLYVHAFRLTGNERFRETAQGIVDWLLREMISPEGAFHAALDADSEGEEGAFYVWTDAEIETLLTAEDADFARVHFGISPSGNFEHGTTIFSIVRTLPDIAESTGLSLAEVTETRDRVVNTLMAARAQRVRPGKDDKIIVSWNALMIRGLVDAIGVLDDDRLIPAASRCASFLLNHCRDASGRLRHTWKDGQTRGDGVLEDYACLADALIGLYVATHTTDWLDAAVALVGIVDAGFRHESGVGFYDTGIDHERLVTRPRDLQDNATPSGNAVMADVLLTLGTMAHREDWIGRSRSIVEGLVDAARQYPTAFGRLLATHERHVAGIRELVFAGPETTDLEAAFSARYLPNVVAGYASDQASTRWPMVADRPAVGNGAAYVCEHFTCLPPVTTADDLVGLLTG